MNLISYSHTSEIINQSGSVESNCNAITFINNGTVTVTVMGYPIQQGYQLYLPGSVGEIDRTNYAVMFDTAAGTRNLLIIRKVYN